MVLIVSWAVENKLVYLRFILVGSTIILVSWAIENNFIKVYSEYDNDRLMIISTLERITQLILTAL